MTIDELFQECLKEHWDCSRFRLSGHFKEVQAKYENHIKKVFGQKDYLTIRRSDIRDWHRSLSATPVTSNRCLEIISKIYKFSIEKEWNEGGYNPCIGIKHYTERKRRRYASEAEIQKIGQILEGLLSAQPVEITFLYTLLYTGARPRSIERSRWDELQEIEGGHGLLVFDGKSTEATGDPESVIIPVSIMKLIYGLPRRKDGLIFGIPLPGYLWRKIRKEAGCPDLWARDFRRTFATVGMSGGVKIDTIGELLNHHSTQTTKRYAKLNNSARLEAVNAISDKLNSILKK